MRGRGIRPGHAQIALIACALLLPATTAAGAALEHAGILVAYFHGDINPEKLPRDRPAPVTELHVGGKVKTADGTNVPPLTGITIDLSSRISIDSKGLAVCSLRELLGTSVRRANQICGDAKIGSGNIAQRVTVGFGEFAINGPVFAFNGRYRGEEAILAHVIAKAATPHNYVIVFVLRRTPGPFGYSLVAEVPSIANEEGYVSTFDLSLGRQYRADGSRHSYVSASCPLLPAAGASSFPLGHMTFGFEDGTEISGPIDAECEARD